MAHREAASLSGSDAPVAEPVPVGDHHFRFVVEERGIDGQWEGRCWELMADAEAEQFTLLMRGMRSALANGQITSAEIEGRCAQWLGLNVETYRDLPVSDRVRLLYADPDLTSPAPPQ